MYKKRIFDFLVSFIGLIFLSPIYIIISFLILIFMGRPILFKQKRIGRNGHPFKIFKFRTMINNNNNSNITVKNDSRITPIGKILRKWKLDELPTIFNVFLGDMSLVGPRPDVPGYADTLIGEDKKILSVRPGITGPATLKYAREEDLLFENNDFVNYNDNVIYPDKVKINLEYIKNWSFWVDFKIIFFTIFRKNY